MRAVSVHTQEVVWERSFPGSWVHRVTTIAYSHEHQAVLVAQGKTLPYGSSVGREGTVVLVNPENGSLVQTVSLTMEPPEDILASGHVVYLCHRNNRATHDQVTLFSSRSHFSTTEPEVTQSSPPQVSTIHHYWFYLSLNIDLVQISLYIESSIVLLSWQTFTCLHLGSLVPLFWISGDVYAGLHRQSGFCLIRIVGWQFKMMA